MKKILIILLFLPCWGGAQEEEIWEIYPTNKEIETEISDPESDFYFPPLFNRFVQNDTTLSLPEYIFLYYGYAFQEAYAPYEYLEDKKLDKLLSKEKWSRKKMEEIIKRSKAGLEVEPFNLDLILYIINMQEELGEQEELDLWYDKYKKILLTILYSGDGVTTQTAYRVITARHEYILLEILELEFGGSQSLIEQCDYLAIQSPNELGVEGLYFDVSLPFRKLGILFGDD